MKLLEIVIFIGCLLLSNLANAEKSLPCDLVDYMNALDIKYEPVNKSDLSDDVLTFDFHAYPEAQIINDFDGDNRNDYALVVNSRGTHVSVVVFLSRDDSYTHRVLWKMNYGENHDKTNIRMIMIPMPESVEGIEGTLELENGGIYVGCVNCPGSAVYYWSDNDFAIFTTSD